jgi:tetrapyrrole methylase family protein / MazG family protein
MTDPSIALANLNTTIQTLRSDLGCPWDRRQTPLTLKKHVEAECAELLTAIDNNDHENTMEELGDVLYLLMMITRMHEEHGHFDFTQVIEGINAKLIRRHPHVFAGQTYENDEQLRAQWQAIKDQEKMKKNV